MSDSPIRFDTLSENRQSEGLAILRELFAPMFPAGTSQWEMDQQIQEWLKDTDLRKPVETAQRHCPVRVVK